MRKGLYGKYRKVWDKDIYEALKLIRDFRKEKGFRLLDMAVNFDVNVSTYMRWEKHERIPCRYYYPSILKYAREVAIANSFC